MTLLITLIAFVIVTFVWYKNLPNDIYNIKLLVYMFGGASLMWFVDAIFEYAQLQAEYFTPALSDLINDAYLGISVIALALITWLISLLIKDPKHVLSSVFKH